MAKSRTTRPESEVEQTIEELVAAQEEINRLLRQAAMQGLDVRAIVEDNEGDGMRYPGVKVRVARTLV